MSTDPYERYKSVLRRAHLAALRGALTDALDAYEEAALLAPERALPLTGRGTVLIRSDRAAEALESFDGALARAPSDGVALAGRADALAALGRRGEAATAFDVLAEHLERAGRLGDACEAARRSLELAESRHRRRDLVALVERLEGSQPDARGRAAIARARSVLDARDAVPSGDAPDDQPPPIEPPPVPIDPAALSRRADEASDQGDTASAREALLTLVRLHRESGRIDAALDAGYRALSIAPGNVELHLALVDLYLERGWSELALEKIRLLGRLVELTDDPAAADRFRATLADRYTELVSGPAPS